MRIGTAICLLLSVVGCSSPSSQGPGNTDLVEYESASVQCIFDRREPGWDHGQLREGLAVAPGDRLWIAADDSIVDSRDWHPIVDDKLEHPYAFALDADGVLFIISGRELGVLIGGSFNRLTGLPNAGYRAVAGSGNRLYLYGPSAVGGTTIYLIDKPSEEETTVQQIATLEGSVSAMTTLNSDLLLAVERDVYRAGLDSENRWVITKVSAIPEGTIRSLALDANRRVLFIATEEATLMIYRGILLPLLAFGGELALGGVNRELLYVYQAAEGRAFKVDIPKLMTALAQG